MQFGDYLQRLCTALPLGTLETGLWFSDLMRPQPHARATGLNHYGTRPINLCYADNASDLSAISYAWSNLILKKGGADVGWETPGKQRSRQLLRAADEEGLALSILYNKGSELSW